MLVERSIGLGSVSSWLLGVFVLALREGCCAGWRRCCLGFEGGFLRSPCRGGGIVAGPRSLSVTIFSLVVVWVKSQMCSEVWGEGWRLFAYRSLSKSHCHYIK